MLYEHAPIGSDFAATGLHRGADSDALLRSDLRGAILRRQMQTESYRRVRYVGAMRASHVGNRGTMPTHSEVALGI